MEENFASPIDTAEEGLRYINALDPKNIETAIIWELQVLKALDLPSVDLILRMEERMKPYEVKMMTVGTMMSFPVTMNSSISLA